MQGDDHRDGDPQGEKARLRRLLGRRRDAIPPEERRRAAERAAEHFLRHELLPASGGLLLYRAIRSELDPAPLWCAAREAGVPVLFPRITGPYTMEPVAVSRPADLVAGPFGIEEPHPSLPAAAFDEVAVVVVPGIAFDRRGYRLGYGGGYYDRFLLAVPQARQVGFTYDALVVPELPREPHDRRVDLIVTDARVVACEEG